MIHEVVIGRLLRLRQVLGARGWLEWLVVSRKRAGNSAISYIPESDFGLPWRYGSISWKILACMTALRSPVESTQFGDYSTRIGYFGVSVKMDPAKVSIADALFTKTQQKVLGLLYGKPDASFFLTEIIRLADVGRGTVVRELNKLCDAGLITVTRKGNQNHFQANSGNPIFAELRGIVIKTFGIADVLRDALEEILPHVRLALIYGSVAKGEAGADSDVDLMIVTEDVSYTELMARLEPAEKQLGRKINPTIYSPAEFEQRKNTGQSFIKRVLEQPIIDLTDS